MNRNFSEIFTVCFSLLKNGLVLLEQTEHFLVLYQYSVSRFDLSFQ